MEEFIRQLINESIKLTFEKQIPIAFIVIPIISIYLLDTFFGRIFNYYPIRTLAGGYQNRPQIRQILGTTPGLRFLHAVLDEIWDKHEISLYRKIWAVRRDTVVAVIIPKVPVTEIQSPIQGLESPPLALNSMSFPNFNIEKNKRYSISVRPSNTKSETHPYYCMEYFDGDGDKHAVEIDTSKTEAHEKVESLGTSGVYTFSGALFDASSGIQDFNIDNESELVDVQTIEEDAPYAWPDNSPIDHSYEDALFFISKTLHRIVPKTKINLTTEDFLEVWKGTGYDEDVLFLGTPESFKYVNNQNDIDVIDETFGKIPQDITDQLFKKIPQCNLERNGGDWILNYEKEDSHSSLQHNYGIFAKVGNDESQPMNTILIFACTQEDLLRTSEAFSYSPRRDNSKMNCRKVIDEVGGGSDFVALIRTDPDGRKFPSVEEVYSIGEKGKRKKGETRKKVRQTGKDIKEVLREWYNRLNKADEMERRRNMFDEED